MVQASSNGTKVCERCGVSAADTEAGMLAYNGSKLVCDDCNSDLDNEWLSDNPGSIHPLDTLNPAAHVIARLSA